MTSAHEIEQDLANLLRDGRPLGAKSLGKAVAEGLMDRKAPEGVAEEVYRRLRFAFGEGVSCGSSSSSD